MPAMTRGTALVSTVAQVVQLTGYQELANLEIGAGITLTDVLITASDTVFDRLTQDGIDPTDLFNGEIFERAVAWAFIEILTVGGYLTVGAESTSEALERVTTMFENSYERVRPSLTVDANEGRRPGEGPIHVSNWQGDTVYANRRRTRVNTTDLVSNQIVDEG